MSMKTETPGRRRAPVRLLAAACACWAACAPARAQEAGAAEAAREGAYVLNRPRSADDWRFVLGPARSPEAALMLVRSSPEGAVAFACRRPDGARSLGVRLAGLRAAPGERRRFRVAVAEDERLLDMVSRPAPDAAAPGGGDVFEAEGPAVPALLKRMGEVSAQRAAEVRFSTGEGADERSAAFGLPEPREVAEKAALICQGWHEAAPARGADSGHAGDPGPADPAESGR